jgi:RNA polymerase sigma-70 factor (ECF subfamily)
VNESDQQSQFEATVLPHLDAAYNLARWLAGNDHDAADIVQEASLRAFRFVAGFRGGNSRSWLLTIVRNTAYTWLKKNHAAKVIHVTDEELTEMEDPTAVAADAMLLKNASVEVLRTAIEALPVEYREALVLRELEGLAYKEIAGVAGVPIGTVMSRLARARKQLQETLIAKGGPDELH